MRDKFTREFSGQLAVGKYGLAGNEHPFNAFTKGMAVLKISLVDDGIRVKEDQIRVIAIGDDAPCWQYP